MNALIQNPSSIPSSVPEAAKQSLEPSLLAGVNVLLEGATGTGKTFSIGTLVDSGVETFYLGLESGMESLVAYWTDRSKPIPPNLHWHTMQIAIPGGFGHLAQAAQQIGSMTQDSLHKLQDFTRAQNNQFENVLKVMNDFSDQRTGTKFGPVDSWGPDRAIVIDGLTGLGAFALAMVTGKKPVKSQPDWGIAQDQVEKFLRYTCDGCKCHFVLLAHIERETDLVMGGSKITVSSLGKALPPKIPPMFSDVILCLRTGTKWNWSTANALCDLKTRSLPVAEDILPDFKQIIDKWRSRGGRFSPTVKV